MSSFIKVKDLYLTRQFRPDSIFGFNKGEDGLWHMSYPNEFCKNANSWQRFGIPVPAEARWAMIFGMYVGGVTPPHMAYMLHIDFRDPFENPSMESAINWEDVGGQGDFYYYYNSRNERCPFGMFPVPCANSQLLLRWKIDNDYGSAHGVNMYLLGFATADEPSAAVAAASRSKRRRA